MYKNTNKMIGFFSAAVLAAAGKNIDFGKGTVL